MPELPDVEGFRRFFDEHAAGRMVDGVTADPTIVRNTSPQGLGRALKRRRFASSRRHGKWLLCPCEGTFLIMHFGMTGSLLCRSDGNQHQHDRVTVALSSGDKLVYRSMRKLGGIWLATDQRRIDDVLGDAGPDAADIPRADFAELLGRKRGRLKPALMDQATIAGLGNLTVDEILWRAGIHPTVEIRRLDEAAFASIHREMRRVLRQASKVGHVPGKASWLTGNRSKGVDCPRCGVELRSRKVAGRTTFFCPRCQPG